MQTSKHIPPEQMETTLSISWDGSHIMLLFFPEKNALSVTEYSITQLYNLIVQTSEKYN